MKKRITIALALTLLLVTALPFCVNAERNTVSVSDGEGFVKAVGGEDYARLADGNTVYLKRDVTLSKTVIINGEITVYGAGCLISAAEGLSGCLFEIPFGGKLILCNPANTDKEETVIFSSDSANTSLTCFKVDGGGLEIYSGTLIQGFTSDLGGGIYISSGSVNIYGGCINGCKADCGGGIYACGGALSFSGGSISACAATSDGGGICACENAQISISGGDIGSGLISNETKSKYTYNEEEGNSANRGGGIFMDIDNPSDPTQIAQGTYTPSITLFAPSVVGNTAERGGGIYITDRCAIALGSGGLAFNEATEGGGIYNEGYVSSLYCTVYGNTAVRGGGVYNTSTFSLEGESKIQSNEAVCGAGIFNGESGSVRQLDDGSVAYNIASNCGGGVVNLGSYYFSDGHITSNKISSEDESHINLGIEAVNAGRLSLGAGAYFGDSHDVALIFEKEGAEIILLEAFTCKNGLAQISPVSISDFSFDENTLLTENYINGTQLLTRGSEETEMSGLCAPFEARNDISGCEWNINSKGQLARASIDGYTLVMLISFAVAIVLAVVYIVIIRKKSGKKEA